MTEHEHPIAAPATALAPSALSVIRCSGSGCIDLLEPLFRPAGRLASADSHTMHHGSIVGRNGESVDEVLVAVFRAPTSYTGEESAEIYGHGSPAGIRRIMQLLYDVGFHPAAPGEFTRRAFLNGKTDLTRAEAINDLVNARTVHAHRLAVDRLEGGVSDAVGAVRSDLVRLMASLSVQLDYPEEDSGQVSLDRGLLVSCSERIVRIAGTYEHGRLLQEGIAVALAGRTNAGKSSLFNALLRQDRSIVSDLPGTTRDYLEATLDIGGIPVRLFDTAGLRPAGHESAAGVVEAEGIRRSRTVLAAANLVLYVVDRTDGLTPDDEQRISEIREDGDLLVVWNKTDLDGPAPPGDAVAVSAITGSGLDDLNDAVVRHVYASGPGTDSSESPVIIDSARQHQLLRRAADALEQTRQSLDARMPADALAVDLQDAIDAIGEITGEVTTDEILDSMFSSFCLGK